MAERVQHRPEHGGVERPVPHRACVARIAGAQQMRGIANGTTEQSGPSGPRTASQPDRDDDRERGSDRWERTERQRPVARHESDGERYAGEHDRDEKHGVQEHQERQQRAGCRGSAETGATQRPHRQGGATGAGRWQQPGRGRARERDLGALPHTDPRGRAAGDERKQNDVPGDRDAFEHERGRRPPAVHAERPMEGGGDRVDPVAAEDHRGKDRRGKDRGHQRAPRQRAQLERRQREIGGGGFGGEHRL